VVKQRGQPRPWWAAQDASDQDGGTGQVERLNGDLAQPPISAQLGSHPAQDMPPRQVIAAVRPNQCYRLTDQPGGESRQKLK
jgi:hypothetical protein